MSLLTFVRKSTHRDVRITDTITALNRLLERTYSDCTCRRDPEGSNRTGPSWRVCKLAGRRGLIRWNLPIDASPLGAPASECLIVFDDQNMHPGLPCCSDSELISLSL
jgi:hypothetical protein